MIPRHPSGSGGDSLQRRDLDRGTPTIAALASLCQQAMTGPPAEAGGESLSPHARAILAAGGTRGVIDIRASKDDFDAVDRFLAICIEIEPGRRLLFRRSDDPESTIRFLDAFAELCRNGMIVHHLGNDFSFSVAGFETARGLDRAELEPLIEFASELDH